MSEPNHLDYRALALAAVESARLPRGQREHLATCAHCRERLRELSGELESLGSLARELAPTPPRRFRLPPEAERASRPWPGRGTLVWGLAAAALLLVIWLGVAGQTPPAGNPGALRAPGLTAAAEDRDQGFVSIMEVEEEDPFTPFQRFVLGEDDGSRDEQFMDFVSPLDQEDYSGLEKGRARC